MRSRDPPAAPGEKPSEFKVRFRAECARRAAEDQALGANPDWIDPGSACSRGTRGNGAYGYVSGLISDKSIKDFTFDRWTFDQTLQCLMRQNASPQRACRSKIRSQLATEINAWFRGTRSLLKIAIDNPKVLDFSAWDGPVVIKGVTDRKDPLVEIQERYSRRLLTAPMSPDILKKVRDLVESRRLSSGDFGWFTTIDPDLKAILDVPVRKDVCDA